MACRATEAEVGIDGVTVVGATVVGTTAFGVTAGRFSIPAVEAAAEAGAALSVFRWARSTRFAKFTGRAFGTTEVAMACSEVGRLSSLVGLARACLVYTSYASDEEDRVALVCRGRCRNNITDKDKKLTK